MNYSSYHTTFAYWLNRNHNINEQDVLDHPENYLGPNYKEVLNYWFYWDSLSDEQWEVLDDRYCALDWETRKKAHMTAIELAKEVINLRLVSSLQYDYLELIAAHLYIERDIPFTFLPQIFDL